MIRQKVKLMLLTSESLEEADGVIDECYNFTTVQEKIAFLRGMFDTEPICDYKLDENTYWSLLHAIIFG